MTGNLANMMNQETLATPAESTTPLRGTGGGLADLIPAQIDGEQPAALSEGEFVFPADVVSMLGDGSSEAGARLLSKLIEEVRGVKQGGENTEQAGGIADLLT
jgi:hypothetical protein